MCPAQVAQNIDYREVRGARDGASSRVKVKREAVAATEAAALDATSGGSTTNHRRYLQTPAVAQMPQNS